jgi:hypothetical protein
MSTVILTLTDTPNGSVSIHSTFKPRVGNPCSPAQSVALEIIARTHKQWGVHIDAAPGGVDIDAVHRLRTVKEAAPCTASI